MKLVFLTASPDRRQTFANLGHQRGIPIKVERDRIQMLPNSPERLTPQRLRFIGEARLDVRVENRINVAEDRIVDSVSAGNLFHNPARGGHVGEKIGFPVLVQIIQMCSDGRSEQDTPAARRLLVGKNQIAGAHAANDRRVFAAIGAGDALVN